MWIILFQLIRWTCSCPLSVFWESKTLKFDVARYVLHLLQGCAKMAWNAILVHPRSQSPNGAPFALPFWRSKQKWFSSEMIYLELIRICENGNLENNSKPKIKKSLTYNETMWVFNDKCFAFYRLASVRESVYLLVFSPGFSKFWGNLN